MSQNQYRTYVTLAHENSKANHYFEITELVFTSYGSETTAESVSIEISRYLAITYPDRIVTRLSVNKH